VGVEEGEQEKTAPVLKRRVAVFNDLYGTWMSSKSDRPDQRSRGGHFLRIPTLKQKVGGAKVTNAMFPIAPDCKDSH
jgi:hypothetical protein